ncbi:hypothetical protein MCAP1_003189 [Malassezia caprae]|uniref:Peptide N-acetyl-beta-D-glucosaminyl asparaginase amidase A N-terminal domain-containing protein n=1 Tax=Malassezia caprae TaxID=1381934 RepID=A0AAF0IWL5_9BASI|nr:hypothetical protein MCAP1_003189 [Malassezia caprae]
MHFFRLCVLSAALIVSVCFGAASATPRRFAGETTSTQKDSMLNVFQLSAPVMEPLEAKCNHHETLMEHTFGNSDKKPFKGQFSPPNCNFNRVVIHFNATVKGRQYDRVGIMYLGSTEVWRTSTAEPTSNGVKFSYSKDMTAYLSLWKKNQTLIFDLPNFVNKNYTGKYQATLSAHFWHDSHPPEVADKILPISREVGQQGHPSVFHLPYQRAMVYHHISKKAVHAHVSIAATGQEDEEFWYTNVFNQFKDDFGVNGRSLPAGGPFREVQLLIDGYLAGVTWPIPVIFTGGIAPNLWRPTVGIDAFDMREQEIDITPWLPYLTDGKSHTFEMRVVGVKQDSETNSTHLSTEDIAHHWLGSAKIFVFYGKTKKGKAHYARPKMVTNDPEIQMQLSHPKNGSMHAKVQVTRTVNISSAAGTWHQSLNYSNENLLSRNGVIQTTHQTFHTTTKSKNMYAPKFNEERKYGMPLSLKTTTISSGRGSDSINVHADVDYTLNLDTTGRPDVSAFSLASGAVSLYQRMTGTSKFSNNMRNNSDESNTHQLFDHNWNGKSYKRDTSTKNSQLVSNV